MGIICHGHLQYVGAKCNASLWTAFMVEEDGKEKGRKELVFINPEEWRDWIS